MQIGIDSFAAAHDDASRAEKASDRMRNLIEQTFAPRTAVSRRG